MKQRTLIFLVVVLISVFSFTDSFAQAKNYFYDYESLRPNKSPTYVLDSAIVAVTNGGNEVNNIVTLNYSLSDSAYFVIYQDSVLSNFVAGDSFRSRVYVRYYGDIGSADIIGYDTLAGQAAAFEGRGEWTTYSFMPKASSRFDLVYEPYLGGDTVNGTLAGTESVSFRRYVYIKKSSSSIRLQTR